MRKQEKRKARISTALNTQRRREIIKRGFGPKTFRVPEGVEIFQLKSGVSTMKINIIPYKVGKGNPMADEGTYHWERTFYVHRNVGPNQEWMVCPQKTASKRCPICEKIAKLQRDPEADQELIKSLVPSKRQLFNVEELSDPGKVKLFEISYHYFGKQLDTALNNAYESEEDNMDNFADPVGGYSLKLALEEGNYGIYVSGVSFKQRPDIPDEILEKAQCLDDLLNIPSYEEILKEMSGMDTEEMSFSDEEDIESEDSEEEDDDNEIPFTDTPKKKGKKAVEEDEEEEDEIEEEEIEEEDDEVEEEEAVPQKKKGKKAVEDEDFDVEEEWEEEEDEIEEEDEEDVFPKRKGKKVVEEDEDEDFDIEEDDEEEDDIDSEEEDEKPKSKKR